MVHHGDADVEANDDKDTSVRKYGKRARNDVPNSVGSTLEQSIRLQLKP